MAILKPIDDNYVCPVSGTDLDGIFRNLFGFNDIAFIETDIAGGHLPNADAYSFFAVNRLLAIRPIETRPSSRYGSAAYDCLLTIAKPIDDRIEVETINVPGQFELITSQFMNLDFLNTLKSYFTCCDYTIQIISCRPIWNSVNAVKEHNHSGVEINLTVTL